MHLRGQQAVSGDPNEPDETLIARFHARFQRTLRPERTLPSFLIRQVMKLNQVDVVCPKGVE
jgi:hypothetical protein